MQCVMLAQQDNKKKTIQKKTEVFTSVFLCVYMN